MLLRFTTIEFFHFRPTNRNNTNNPPIYTQVHVLYMRMQTSNFRGETTAAASSKQENITNVIINYYYMQYNLYTPKPRRGSTYIYIYI